ncbi:MAG TPA: crotonase/enoyl-CoA hydratase family protein [Xanthobacteraceae bacterium]|nr:crotonase/enoyl-CoA hydratase family protein [Xanthobacteraceae bacterium]
MTNHVLVRDDAAVRTIRMNRPEKRNALTAAMYADMARAIREAKAAGIRCLLIAGSTDAFSAGNDLQDFMTAGSEDAFGPVMDFLAALAECPLPLVAAVQGVAVGIGTTMLMHCDQVIASDEATFATPFVSLGLVPEAASSLLAPRLMGLQRAFSLLVMGERLDAHTAAECGIVTYVRPANEVEVHAAQVAKKIAALPPEAVRLSRRLIRGEPQNILARIEEEATLFNARLASPEAQAAFAAFFARKPR